MPPAVLPHHRTYSSYPAVFVNVVTSNTDRAGLSSLVSRTKRYSCPVGHMANAPSATSPCHRLRSSSIGSRVLPEPAENPRWLWDRFRCFNRTQTEFTANPLVQCGKDGFRLCMAKVRHPARKERVQLADHPLEAHASIAAGDCPNPIFRPDPDSWEPSSAYRRRADGGPRTCVPLRAPPRSSGDSREDEGAPPGIGLARQAPACPPQNDRT